MECEFYTGQSGAEYSERIYLSNGKNIQFSQNSKSENPKFSVRVNKDKQFICTLGSVFKEEINMTIKSLKQLAIMYHDDINFLSRAKYVVNGDMVILGANEEQFEELLDYATNNFI